MKTPEQNRNDLYTRRRFLRQMASGLWILTGGAACAEALTLTPRQTMGPFYPDRLPLDRDNDLIIVGKNGVRSEGKETYLSGRILNARGNPIKNAVVEIWQVDNNGVYLHNGSFGHASRDRNFQGFGRFETGSKGEYLFRTIKPVPYPGRTPHIHIAVKIKGQEPFATQCYVKGEPGNTRDLVLQSIRDPRQRASVIVPFVPLKGKPSGALLARFDIVLGMTPAA
ncbi:MAG: intradiol ring-cleavage dioxygenase [Armatimonadetes bacterium]|nr:intradiol ring-cleavage dioxygenase [Armatimonadota bacterium]